MRTILQTLLASLIALAAGVGTLAATTHGFRAFTSETARRIDVREHPRVVPATQLETAGGEIINLEALRGQWLLVDFIYTRCMTYCSVQGSQYAQLQDRMAPLLEAGTVRLLSISFDPAHDAPEELAAYQRRSGDRGNGWIAARPTDSGGLQALLHVFGVTVIPDGIGGYVHNAAIAVVDADGRLVRIFAWDAAAEAERYVRDRVSS